MRLSYSNYRYYLNCPRLYNYVKSGAEPPEPPSEYFSLYGRLIEKFFKRYTNDFTKNGVLLSDGQVKKVLEKEWEYLLEKAYVCWTDPWVKEGSDDIFENVYHDTLKNLKAFDFWKDARAEVSVRVKLKKSQDELSCRMDFIHVDKDGVVQILDGKGTNKIDTNVDVEQLYFYTLMYLLNYKKLPHKIGFLYYKYQMIKYVDFNMDTIMKFKDKLSLVKKAINSDEAWEPKVKLSKHCKWCAYRFDCDAFRMKKEANAAKRREKKGLLEAAGTGEMMDLG